MRVIRIGVTVLATVVLVYVGGWPSGPLPALGRFLDPVHGVWSVAMSTDPPRDDRLIVDGLQSSVEIEYDDRGVPHIFATSTEDAVWALGYVVARDRLFQLELQTRATAGTLTEVLGPDALDADRFQRQLGLAWSADREWAALDRGSPAARLVTAYAGGVNAWINGLAPSQLPFEYHLLGFEPQQWDPVHSFYLTRRMGYTLTYSTIELWRDDVVQRVGDGATDALFPVNAPIQEPIQPGGRENYPWFDTSPLPPPSPLSLLSHLSPLSPLSHLSPLSGDEVGRRASNNWVVSGTRSSTGLPILAGDPHLNLSLPSIWYEVHIVVEGELDAYGVTIPGSPGLLIGFNRDVAWSLTNVGADVLDYYREEIDDLAAPTQYRLDGAWERLERRIETYRDPSGKTIAVDSMYHTHRGPVRVVGGAPYSLRWTNLDGYAGKTSMAFDAAARATSVAELADAFRELYPSSQNVVMADRHGSIGIRSTGWFPLRPDGAGVRSQDGTTRSADWSSRWPVETYPGAIDPRQGYLASANQQPLDPFDNAAYLGVNWPSPWRAMRINRLLREDSSVTPDEMRRFQTDPGNERAELFVPLFLETAREGGGVAFDMLRSWDRRFVREDTVAVFFERVMDEVKARVWDELLDDPSDESSRRVATPSEQVLWRVLQQGDSPWCDDRRTEETESCAAIVDQSVERAFQNTVERFGQPGAEWRWERHRRQNIYHLLGIGPLSRLGISVQGGSGNLNPSSGRGTHGASWRMVVELGSQVSAQAIYPGGQSGNPVSDWYDDRIDKWQVGELDDVLFPESAGRLGDRMIGRVTLLAGGGR